MYQPELGRFTARDPMPENGVLVGGIPQNSYWYADNNVINQIDPSGLAPSRIARGDQPGTFNIEIKACTAQTLKVHPGCCCSEIYVGYKPTDADKAKYKKICLTIWERTRFKKNWFCSDTDEGWKEDVPEEKQTCWPPTPPTWYDYPGGQPYAGVGCGGLCATTQIRQDFEGCAIGTTASGKTVNLGCTWWGHECNAEHKEVGGQVTPYNTRLPGCCVTTCSTQRFPNTKRLYDIEPKAQKPGTWDPISDPPHTY